MLFNCIGLLIVENFLVHTTIPTLWSGTNASLVSIFVLHIPQRTTGDEIPKPIVGQLAKEIQIKHRAPVISIALFDSVKFYLLIFEKSSHYCQFLEQYSSGFPKRSWRWST